jgi:hypothetical protein
MKVVFVEMKNALLRVATVVTTLMVGLTFLAVTNAFAGGEVKKVVVEKPLVVEKVVEPVKKVVVVKEAKVDSSSAVVVRPFVARPFFFRPFFFNPFFFEEDFD